MEDCSHSFEAFTPGVTTYTSASFRKCEDSGYHTSFTPGSVDCSGVLSENFDQSNYNITLEDQIERKYKPKCSLSVTESPFSSPVKRRGVKRPYHDVGNENFLPTPTTAIAGGIQKLTVTDSSVSTSHSSLCIEYLEVEEFPQTPIKKQCRSSCKLTPLRKSSKKASFAIHSLTCANSGLQRNKEQRQRPHSKVVRTIQFNPEQKIDIVKKLFEMKFLPPLEKIIGYLSNEDISIFSTVSHDWQNIWNQVSYNKVKVEYNKYLKNVKENQENRDVFLPIKSAETQQIRSLKEVHNVLNANKTVNTCQRSPPSTPRTNKFKKFTKSASLDSRLQLLCVRCGQPAKVTKEPTGEEWAECTSITCSYCFCRFCSCNRHPGKTCANYGLDGPSPSKRKKNLCGISSTKSRRILRRLLL